MYFPVSALLIEYMILTVVESKERIYIVSDIEETAESRISDYLLTGVSGTKEKILLNYRGRKGTDYISEQ